MQKRGSRNVIKVDIAKFKLRRVSLREELGAAALRRPNMSHGPYCWAVGLDVMGSGLALAR